MYCLVCELYQWSWESRKWLSSWLSLFRFQVLRERGASSGGQAQGLRTRLQDRGLLLSCREDRRHPKTGQCAVASSRAPSLDTWCHSFQISILVLRKFLSLGKLVIYQVRRQKNKIRVLNSAVGKSHCSLINRDALSICRLRITRGFLKRLLRFRSFCSVRPEDFIALRPWESFVTPQSFSCYLSKVSSQCLPQVTPVRVKWNDSWESAL